MAEYISKQAFKEKYLCCGWLPEMSEEEFNSFPAADVVEVTFCKDCRYYQDAKVNEKGFLICPASGMEITEMDYCSYGQHKIETVLPKSEAKDESLEETHANTRKNAR